MRENKQTKKVRENRKQKEEKIHFLFLELICDFSLGTKLDSFGVLSTDITNTEVDTTYVC